MPDLNKLEALDSAGFMIRPTCLRCEHFDEGANAWGTCRKITYEHLKHTSDDKPRQASVPVDGWCPQYSERYEAVALLGAHRAFFKW